MILFHTGIGGVSGGFIGVDVFFVISGYLITSIIVRDIDAKRFRIADFYERRIRRIYPALLLVLAVTAVAAHLFLMPREYGKFGRTLAWTPLFASNFAFIGPVGYFQPTATLKPLLHTWSLGVEEQFYLVFPILLAIAARWRLPRTGFLAVVVVLSLVGSVVAGAMGWSNAYFLLPTRFWELGFGALLASRSIEAMPIRSPLLRHLVGVAGLAAVIGGAFAIDSSMPFPGWVALVPVVGASAVIVAKGSVGDRLLSLPPLVFVGRISYPMYLWHWPLVVFTEAWFFHPPTPLEGAGVIAATVLASWATLVLLESPIRRRIRLPTRRALFGTAAAASSVLVVWGVVLVQSRGMPSRLDRDTAAILAETGRNPGFGEGCPTDHTAAKDGRSDCPIGTRTSAEPSFALLGDSHAWVLVRELHELAKAEGVWGLFLGHLGCPPLRGIDHAAEHCDVSFDAALDKIRARGIPSVIIVSRWAKYVTGRDFGRDVRQPVRILRGGTVIPEEEQRDAVAAGLKSTVEALTGRRVTLVFSFPEQKFPVPSAIAAARHLGRPAPLGVSRAEYEARQKPVRDLMGPILAQFPNVEVVEPADVFCRSGRCIVEHDWKPLYFDEDHLSSEGSRLWVPALLPILRRASERRSS